MGYQRLGDEPWAMDDTQRCHPERSEGSTLRN